MKARDEQVTTSALSEPADLAAVMEALMESIARGAKHPLDSVEHVLRAGPEARHVL